MVEDVVYADVDHGIFTELFLHHEVPDTEALFLVLLVLCDRRILFHRVVVCTVRKRIAVEHTDIVVAPELREPACLLVLVGDADVHLMCRAVEQAIRHERVALVECVEIGVAEPCVPVRPDLLPHLCLKTRDLRTSDVLEAVDHIRRTHPLGSGAELRGKVHIFPGEVDAHIVSDAVVEDARARIGVLRLALDAHVEIDRFLGPQIGIAFPPPAHACNTDTDRAAAVHLPVVPQLAHARLCIARADVRLEAEMRITSDVVRHTNAAGDVRAEEVAVIDAQDGEEHCVL